MKSWIFLVFCGLLCVVCSSDSDIVVSSTMSNQVNNHSENAASCLDVKQVYIIKNIGPIDDVPSNKIDGSNLTVCTSTETCCTQSMEEAYEEAVKKDFWTMLQSSSADLKSHLHSSSSSFRDNVLSMILVSRNNTNVLFSEVYKKMDLVAQGPVSRLYSDLTAYLLGHSLELETKVTAFFDRLFPLVYHHSINPKLKDFSEDYKECLRQTQREIRPFGDIADKVTKNVVRAFKAARSVLEAFDLGLEVVNATDHMIFSQDCTRSLLKLVYCAHCRGNVYAKPCSGYCLNVARGCLASVAELDQPWIDFLSAMERLTSGFVSTYNVEEVLSVLDTKISEAIMFAMENGPELSKRVKVACGHPRRATRDAPEVTVPVSGTTSARIVPVRTNEHSLYMRLQQMVQKLAETKGQYANLADVLCSDDSWAVRKEGRCWNGESLGEYTKTIAGVGIAAQRYNPEMEPPTDDDIMVTTLSAKLELMSRQLRQSVFPERPQSDSYMIEGSGSGGWMQTNRIAGAGVDDDGEGDDADDRGSGSGDWGGTSRSSDFNFDSGDVRHRDIHIKPAGSTGSISHSVITTLGFSLIITFRVLWHL